MRRCFILFLFFSSISYRLIAQQDSLLALKQFISLLNLAYQKNDAIQFSCDYQISVLDSGMNVLSSNKFHSNAKTYKNLSISSIDDKVMQINTNELAVTVLKSKGIVLIDSPKATNFTQFNPAQFIDFIHHHKAAVSFHKEESLQKNIIAFNVTHPKLAGGKLLFHIDNSTGFILDFLIQVRQEDFYGNYTYQQIEMKAYNYQYVPFVNSDFVFSEYLIQIDNKNYQLTEAYKNFKLLDNRIKPVFSKKP